MKLKKYKKFAFILLILFLMIIYNLNIQLCLICRKYYQTEKKCFYCQKTVVFKGLTIVSDEETIKEIVMKNKSISRFGDGEFKVMNGLGAGFQKPNKKLAKRLLEVLHKNEKDLLIGLYIPYKIKDFTRLKKHAKDHWTTYIKENKFKIVNLIDTNKKYYSATISRFYMRHKIQKNVPQYIKLLKKIWNSKDILIIEGERTKVGIGNDLLDNAKSIKRIICPYKDAFDIYDRIIKEVIKFHEKRLILIALGPTASILAYDLYKLGYQAIDIGHIDLEYEWYLRNCTRPVLIENKYVNEVRGNYKYKKVDNRKYYSQIIQIIKNN
jgi:glycosyltransferase family protein